MRGRVIASKLNVRTLPSLSAKKIAILKRDTVVSVLNQLDDWLEIRYAAMSAYVASDFVQIVDQAISMHGRITASRLNVRSEPRLHAQTLGTLMWNSRVDILDETGEWLEIAFNERSAFIHQDYVELIETRQKDRAMIDADRLNVRAGPGTAFAVLGILERGEKIKIISRIGNWCEISFNDTKGYVLGDFLADGAGESSSAPVVSPADAQESISEQTSLFPDQKLPLTGNTTSKNVARTWNKFGGVLEELCGAYKIDPGIALAVFCVESSGKGFEPRNDNRLIIRFENHHFWKYWGKQNPQKFHQHFKYGIRENNRMKSWKGHFWREDPEASWQKFHGSQAKEWQVLEFARQISDTAALYSISMGAPQVMGSNCKATGYDTVQEMFDKFCLDIRYHIQGFFNFLDSRMIRALQQRDFTSFAGYYNGSGQKQKYGGWIQNHFDAYQELIS